MRANGASTSDLKNIRVRYRIVRTGRIECSSCCHDQIVIVTGPPPPRNTSAGSGVCKTRRTTRDDSRPGEAGEWTIERVTRLGRTPPRDDRVRKGLLISGW